MGQEIWDLAFSKSEDIQQFFSISCMLFSNQRTISTAVKWASSDNFEYFVIDLCHQKSIMQVFSFVAIAVSKVYSSIQKGWSTLLLRNNK